MPPQNEPEHEPDTTRTMPTFSESPPPPQAEPETTITVINSITFNQDNTAIVAATTTGVLTLSTATTVTATAAPLLNIPFPNGITTVQQLFRSNLLALVGGHFPPTKVMIYDTDKSACVGELRSRSAVVAVRLRRDRIVVVLSHKVLVYQLANLEIVNQIDTSPNPKGLCEISYLPNSCVLVCPALQAGQLRVELYQGRSRKTKFISAHNSSLGCLGLTTDGRYVATASAKGTLIRVFNALDGTFLREVRRGTDRAEIHSLAFSSDAQWLAASSDKGTIHVFSLKLESGSPAVIGLQSPVEQPVSPRSPMSSISFMKGVLPKYFSSEWSLAQYHLKEGTRYIVAFGDQGNTILIVGMDGSFYRCGFDPVSGGEMTQLERHNILKPEEPSES